MSCISYDYDRCSRSRYGRRRGRSVSRTAFPYIERAKKAKADPTVATAVSSHAKKKKPTAEEHELIKETVKRVFTPHLISHLQHKHPVWTKVSFKWQQTLKRLLPIGGASEGNRVTIYDNGDEAYTNMLYAIEHAKHKVWLETYIFEPDHIGKKFINALVKAAKSGCDVRVIYDYLGSSRLHSGLLRPLVEAGGQVIPFNSLKTWPWRYVHWGLFRNHRKILLVDDNVAFTGGMNIGDDYASPKIGGTGYFRDTHTKVEGPAIKHLTNVYLNSLNEAGIPTESDPSEGDPLLSLTPVTHRAAYPIPLPLQAKQEEEPGVFLQVLQSNVRRDKMHIQKAIRLTLESAQKHCYFTTPYFLPPQPLKKALIRAAKRGTDIRILTAGVSDVPLAKFASQHVYDLLLRNGVKIYELFGSALHAKTVTIDGIYSSIGSFNLDTFSHYYNLEINITTLDHRVATQIEEHFIKDLQRSTEVTIADLEKRTIFQKVVHWAAYHVLRIFSFKPFYKLIVSRSRKSSEK